MLPLLTPHCSLLTVAPLLAAYLLCLTLLLGATMGSFCNAWAWRLTHGESIARGRSHCAVCGHTLGARDLIPLLSWLMLRGKCRYCGAPIAKRYPAAEAICALAFLSVVLRYDFTFDTVRFLIAACLLLTAALVDLDIREIPNRLIAGIAAAALLRFPTEGWQGIFTGLLGAAAIFVPLLLFVLAADRFMGRETMGGADLKLLAALGLHFSPALMLMLLIFACFIGIAFALLSGQKADSSEEPAAEGGNSSLLTPHSSLQIPFGPSIALAAWLVALIGAPLLKWYLSLFIF